MGQEGRSAMSGGYSDLSTPVACNRSSCLSHETIWFELDQERSTNPIRIQGHRRADALYSSNWSDSRQRFESGLCLGFANSLPLAVGAMVFEVCQIGVLRREQPVFLSLGLRP